tara:strand:+ start:3241 stop:4470 length:1230 start_codon:yes stop_codon:yes gene_type:complete
LDSLELPKRISLVHEWFTPRSVGGAEQVVKAIDELLSFKGCETELAALVDGESFRYGSWLANRAIQTSFIQQMPFGVNHVQKYLPLLPFAIEQLDFSGSPLVISSNHLVAKGVLLSPNQLHVSYIHTPVRYAWDQMNIYLRSSSLRKIGLGPFIRWQLHLLRQWDQLSAARVNFFLANSRFTARRIARYWGRESEVIHPPVAVDRFKFDQSRDEFYLCLCRLVPNKRVDLVVQAFNELKLPVLVVGDGPQKDYLKSIAGPTVNILGYQKSEKVISLMERCRAYVYAGIEDFGIAPVEAMAAGAPVIAFGEGGLLDTVRCASKGVSSPTGILFPSQNVSSLIQAVRWFEESKLWKEFDPQVLNAWANRFSKEAFKIRFEKVLFRLWKKHQKSLEESASDPALMKHLKLGH